MVQLTEAERLRRRPLRHRGASGGSRFRIEDIDASGEYAVGLVELVEEPDAERTDPAERALQVEADRTLATFEIYRQRLSEMRGDLVLAGELPRDPTYLSWSLAAHLPADHGRAAGAARGRRTPRPGWACCAAR